MIARDCRAMRRGRAARISHGVCRVRSDVNSFAIHFRRALPMRHSIVLSACAFFGLSFLAMPGALAQNRDVAGSRDYPGIGRFAGSVISGYAVKDFDATRLQAAPFKEGRPADER